MVTSPGSGWLGGAGAYPSSRENPYHFAARLLFQQERYNVSYLNTKSDDMLGTPMVKPLGKTIILTFGASLEGDAPNKSHDLAFGQV
eukprot:3933762-Amphidinium_carterae.1